MYNPYRELYQRTNMIDLYGRSLLWIQLLKSIVEHQRWIILWQKLINYICMSRAPPAESTDTKTLIFCSGLLKRKPLPAATIEDDRIVTSEAKSLHPVSQSIILTTIKSQQLSILIFYICLITFFCPNNNPLQRSSAEPNTIKNKPCFLSSRM